MKELVCIMCPMGCHLTCQQQGKEIIVSGNNCARGPMFAKAELTNPTRILTALVRTAKGSGLERGEDLENFVFEAGKAPQTIREHKVGPCRAGTGDVFSSIIAADAVNGVELAASVRHASTFIAKALRRTVELGVPETDGICFEEHLSEL